MSDQDPTAAVPTPGAAGPPPGPAPIPGPGGTGPGGPGGDGPGNGEGTGDETGDGANRTAIVVGLIVLIALVLGLTVFFLTRSDGDSSARATTSSTTTASTTTTSTTTTESTTTTTEATTSSTATTTATTTTTTTTTTIAATIVLSSTGIGSASFGDGQSATLTAATASLGAPTEEGPPPDCPAGVDYQARWQTFFTTFTGGSFVGWEYRGAPSGLATGEGITIGSTIGDARAVWPALTISESTLGPEWTVPFSGGTSISGLATGLTDSATITEMWSGTICIFR